jgi:hypothetical protein
MRLRLAFLLVVPIWILATIWLASSGECGGGGSCIATAKVNDLRYAFAATRSMRISASDLTPYAVATRLDPGRDVIDKQAYRLGSVDPTKVLVMKLVPGQTDEAGPLGEYLLLVSFEDSSAWELMCPYFAPNDALAPTVCSSPPAS